MLKSYRSDRSFDSQVLSLSTMNDFDVNAAREFSIQVIRRLKEQGHQALWAGGCVRDQLVKKTPHDYDVATDAEPKRIREIFGHNRTLAIGESFGVITVLGGKKAGQIEVATFREDLGYTDGRRPDEVRFSSAEQDAQRRDFTINGLFFDPLTNETLDFVGGRRDLRDELVRAIGNPNDRIAEDKLRMLRAVRFASTFGFQLQQNTYDAVRRHSESIHVVSAERIAMEMRKMLVHTSREQAVVMLRDVGLLRELLPELDNVAGHALRWCETMTVIRELRQCCFATALAGLLRFTALRSLAENCDPRKVLEPVASICNRWKLTNVETKDTQWLLRHERLIRFAHQIPWPKLQRILIDPRIDHLLQLATAINLAKADSTDGIQLAKEKLRLPQKQLNPDLLVTGDDLIKSGLKPGKHFRQLLEELRDRQLMGQLTSAAEAVDFAQNFDPATIAE